jgi:hypothetical protein
MKKFVLMATCVCALAAGAAARQAGAPAGGQAPAPPTSVAAEVNGFYTRIAGFIVQSAEMVPADKYTWAATPEVRSYARLFAHITDDNNGACWQSAGLAERPATVDARAGETAWAADKMSKADLQKGLADSVALCEKAFKAVTPANMMEIPGGRGTRTRIGSLIYNTSHINEHYGNLVTYLRLQNMVPPSSVPAGRGRGGY